MGEKVLEVKNLNVAFNTKRGNVVAVQDVNFFMKKGETLGVIGESGSGKSVTALSIMRLHKKSTSSYSPQSEINFKHKNLLKLNETEMRKIRGREISMVFQDPLMSLNPVYTIGYQVAEVLKLHRGMNNSKEINREIIRILNLVGISSPEKRLNQYPNQLSGGMRQRVMIAIALSCHPKLLIADEPTTALDVTIQHQILTLLKELKVNLDLSIILITHDMGVIADMADRVVVMYAGKAVETGKVDEIFDEPLHPYTRGLLSSIIPINQNLTRLKSIGGDVPSPHSRPNGCYFSPRCPLVIDRCVFQDPPYYLVNSRSVSCWLHDQDNDAALAGEVDTCE